MVADDEDDSDFDDDFSEDEDDGDIWQLAAGAGAGAGARASPGGSRAQQAATEAAPPPRALASVPRHLLRALERQQREVRCGAGYAAGLGCPTAAGLLQITHVTRNTRCWSQQGPWAQQAQQDGQLCLLAAGLGALLPVLQEEGWHSVTQASVHMFLHSAKGALGAKCKAGGPEDAAGF